MLSNQEIMDLVWKTFVTEQRPCCFNGGECRYIPTDECAEGAVGCAVGCLLTEEQRLLWKRVIGEGEGVEDIAPNRLGRFFDLGESYHLLLELQMVHDRIALELDDGDDPLVEWREQLTEVCRDFELSVPQG